MPLPTIWSYFKVYTNISSHCVSFAQQHPWICIFYFILIPRFFPHFRLSFTPCLLYEVWFLLLFLWLSPPVGDTISPNPNTHTHTQPWPLWLAFYFYDARHLALPSNTHTQFSTPRTLTNTHNSVFFYSCTPEVIVHVLWRPLRFYDIPEWLSVLLPIIVSTGDIYAICALTARDVDHHATLLCLLYISRRVFLVLPHYARAGSGLWRDTRTRDNWDSHPMATCIYAIAMHAANTPARMQTRECG